MTLLNLCKGNTMTTTILNLTQHSPTPVQVAEGVVESKKVAKEVIMNLLNFRALPTLEDVNDRAIALVEVVKKEGATRVMVGGAPYLMGKLETLLIREGVQVLYSFSERRSVETTSPEGVVSKTAIFEHVGWIEVK